MTDLIERLKAEEPDEELRKLKNRLVRDVKRSRNYMSRFYDEWDSSIELYRSVHSVDKEDQRSRQLKQPPKQVIPTAYAQVQVMVTYLVSIYTQNPAVFELSATGDEDYPLREVSNKILARETRNNNFTAVLTEFFLNVARMNLGVLKTSWIHDTYEITEPAEQVQTEFMEQPNGTLESLISETLDIEVSPETTNEVTLREGSQVDSISPFNFFYDTRLPITRWREGRFAADETSYHIDELKDWETQEIAYGTEFLKPFDAAIFKERGKTVLEGFDNVGKNLDEDDFMCVVTSVQMWVIPSKYKLSESTQRELWLFKVANDDRIISAEPMNDANMSFTYDIATMSPDQHSELSDSLIGLITELSKTITWLINSRIAAVKQNVEGRFIIHANAIDVADIESRSKYITVKRSVPTAMPVDNFIKQLKTVDPTINNVSDINIFNTLLQQTSGVNDNMMGQFNSGRRAATEARNVASGAAARMALIGKNIWGCAIEPCGKRLLINARQWMSEETYLKIVGNTGDAPLLYQEFNVESWWSLIGSEDFFVYDGTSSNEKALNAQALQEMVIAIMSNPEVAMTSQLDPVKIFEEVQRLRGVTNISRFRYTPDELAQRQAQQQAQMALQAGGPPGGPGPAANPGA